MKRIYLLLLLVITINLSAQMQKFPLLEPISKTIPESFIIEGDENELLMFWIDSTDLHMSRSLDDGSTWNSPTTLEDNTIISDSLSDLNALKLNSGRILVTYKFKFHYLIYSDDNGLTWSTPIQLETEYGIVRPRQIVESSLSQTNDNKIWFVYNRLNVIYNIQSSDGSSWSARDTIKVIDGAARFASVNSDWSNSLVLIYQRADNGTSELYESTSLDSGKTWSDSGLILDDEIPKERIRVVKGPDKTIWLTYSQLEPTIIEEYNQSNIFYSKLIDGSSVWSATTKFSKHIGFDGWQNISIANGKPYISFTSDRGKNYTLWRGIADETEDSGVPPTIFDTNIDYQNDYPKVNINISATVHGVEQIDSVLFYYQVYDGEVKKLQLFDDGLHNDFQLGDFIFGNRIEGLSKDFKFNIFYSAVDVFGNRNTTDVEIIESPLLADGADSFVFDNNNLWFPINSKGVLADVKVVDITGFHFDESIVMYSAGFGLSGYTNGELWSNGVMSASSIIDYVHGAIDSVESVNRIHVVRKSQPDFYQSWVNWKDAVKQGADFYDGDGDGIYNPVDLNGNSVWDINEDKPDILGDITAFSVFNDGMSSRNRTFNDVEPQGIEIKQTVFSYDKATSPELANVIFVRYKIENMGTVADRMDSVYFGAWVDVDLGFYGDDLAGTDSTLNSFYAYNSGNDDLYGTNPPAILISFLQAPPIYIDGETYIDTDGNGTYDDGIDTPLDSARNRKGELLGLDEYPGSKNNKLTSSTHYISGHPTQGDPHNESQLRNYMLGNNEANQLIDPCNWAFGGVYNEDCSSINSRLMYSGDPVTKKGWVNRGPDDQRQMGSTGPFDLVKGEPITILVAYIVGRGTDALNSITETRRITNDVIGFYNTNFSYVPVGVKENTETQLPTEYSLSQNYPNPFNPSTVIRYEIGDTRFVILKIYNTLGQEVTTLVNKQQKAGSYEVTFDASNLTSGVYFYRLQITDYRVVVSWKVVK